MPVISFRALEAMPINVDIEIDEERECIVAGVRGDFTPKEILEATDRSGQDLRFPQDFGVLSDQAEAWLLSGPVGSGLALGV